MSPGRYIQLVDEMARMELRADASRYLLGYVWWILEPALYVTVFYVVFKIVLNSGRGDFLVFLICGKFAFIWFSKSVTQASNSIIANKGLIAKLDTPKSLFPMVIVQQSTYKQAAVFVLLFVMLVLFGYEVSWNWLWVIPLMVTNYLLILACSFIGACLVCLIRDFKMVISLAMIFLLFVSGIFWDVRALEDPAIANAILIFNPLAFLLDAYRQVLMYHSSPDIGHLFALMVGSALLVWVLVAVMRKANSLLALKALTS